MIGGAFSTAQVMAAGGRLAVCHALAVSFRRPVVYVPCDVSHSILHTPQCLPVPLNLAGGTPIPSLARESYHGETSINREGAGRGGSPCLRGKLLRRSSEPGANSTPGEATGRLSPIPPRKRRNVFTRPPQWHWASTMRSDPPSGSEPSPEVPSARPPQNPAIAKLRSTGREAQVRLKGKLLRRHIERAAKPTQGERRRGRSSHCSIRGGKRQIPFAVRQGRAREADNRFRDDTFGTPTEGQSHSWRSRSPVFLRRQWMVPAGIPLPVWRVVWRCLLIRSHLDRWNPMRHAN